MALLIVPLSVTSQLKQFHKVADFPGVYELFKASIAPFKFLVCSAKCVFKDGYLGTAAGWDLGVSNPFSYKINGLFLCISEV